MSNPILKNSYSSESDSESIYLKNLEWDSQLLDMRCGIIDCSHVPATTHQNLVLYRINELLQRNREYAFITLKLPSSYTHMLNSLMSDATHLIDTELIYQFNESAYRPTDTDVMFVDRIDPTSLVSLADEMEYSRFFTDERLPNERAKKLWQESIANHCNGRADQIAVVTSKGIPAGIAILHFTGDHTIRLFMVGVLKYNQRKGLGTDLLCAVTQKYSASHDIFVETSCRNIAAQRLYLKSGFKYNDMRYILHKVSKG